MSDKISTLVNLISPKIGSYGVYANDEFFAPLGWMDGKQEEEEHQVTTGV